MIEEFHTLLARLHVAALRSEVMAAKIPRPSSHVARFQRAKVTPYMNAAGASRMANKKLARPRVEVRNFYI